MRKFDILVLVLFAISGAAFAESPGWKNAKNIADDRVYHDRDRSFYCGCITTSDNDDNGSGSVSLTECGYIGPRKYSNVAERNSMGAHRASIADACQVV